VGRRPLDVGGDGLALRGVELAVERVDGLVERIVELLQGEQPLVEELHHHPPPVRRVVRAARVPGPGEPVDDAGDGPGGEPGGPGELSGRLGPAGRQQRQDLQVGAGDPDPVGEDLLEEAGRLAELAQDEEQVVGAGGREGWRG
jgi:hypothetical protein